MTTLDIGEQRYRVDFRGFDKPLGFDHECGQGRLLPWTLGAHLQAMDRYLVPLAEDVDLNTIGWAADVLDATLVGCASGPSLYPLALWWGSGGSRPLRRPDHTGLLELAMGCAWLRPLSKLERLKIMVNCISEGPHGTSLHLVHYLRQLLAVQVTTDLDLMQLDAHDSASLLQAVAAWPLALEAPGAMDRPDVIIHILADRP